MNANTSGYPGSEGDGQWPDRDLCAPPAGDSYSDRDRTDAAPDLDGGAPEFRPQDFRRMNRRAFAFLGAIVLLLIILAWFLYHSATGPRPAPKQRGETLVVPELPQPAIRTALPEVASQTPINPIAQAVQPVPPLPVLPARPRNTKQSPSLLARREMSDNPAGVVAPAPQAPATRRSRSPLGGFIDQSTNAKPLAHPDSLLLRGTYIRCVLESRIVSDIPGFTSCNVVEPVYSFDGRQLLIPKGSKVMGSYEHSPVGERIAVVWDRIVTPDGVDVNLSSPGVDGLGGSGTPGHLDSHWPGRISSAVLISLMSDAFLYEGEKHGPQTASIGAGGVVVQSPYQSNTAQTLQNLANQAVRQSANRTPTLAVNQGSIVTIYVAKDVDFSGVVARL
jgi:type IV secretion system protein VirB10